MGSMMRCLSVASRIWAILASPTLGTTDSRRGLNVKVWLDRGLANADFLNLFNTVKVWHVQTMESDHCCLILECSHVVQRRNRKKRLFRYENMWMRDSSYVQMVESAWGAHDTPACLNQFAANIGHVLKVMQEWERSSFGLVRQELARMRSELENVRRQSLHSRPSRQERQLMAKMSELLSREECMEK